MKLIIGSILVLWSFMIILSGLFFPVNPDMPVSLLVICMIVQTFVFIIWVDLIKGSDKP